MIVNEFNPYSEARIRLHLVEGLSRGYSLCCVLYFCRCNPPFTRWERSKISFPCRAKWIDRIFFKNSYEVCEECMNESKVPEELWRLL